jgi:hypothetical protein
VAKPWFFCTCTLLLLLLLLLCQVRDVLAAVTGEAFDSLLINYYPDGKAGMR